MAAALVHSYSPTAGRAHSNPSTTLPPPASGDPSLQRPGRSLPPPRAIQRDTAKSIDAAAREAASFPSLDPRPPGPSTRPTRRRWPSTATTIGRSQPPLLGVLKPTQSADRTRGQGRGGGSKKELSDPVEFID